MVKIKRLLMLFVLVFSILSVVVPVYAVELPNEHPVGIAPTSYDTIIIGEVNYIPHGVMGLGDAILTQSLRSYTDYMINNYSSHKTAYFVSFTRDVNIRLRDATKDDLIDGVRSAVFVFDFYKTFGTFRIYVYYFDASGDIIFSSYYAGFAVVFEPITYVLGDTPYNNGFNDGLIQGEKNGYIDGYDVGFIDGQDYGFDEGYNIGYDDGFNSTQEGGFWQVLWSAILAPFGILNIEMLPGITLAMIVAVPLVFGLLGWILSTGKSRK